MLEDLLFISLTVGVVAGGVLLVGPLLRRRYVMARMYLVWLILALRLLIPFRVELDRPPVQIPIMPPSGMQTSQQETGTLQTAEKSVTAADVLPWVWGAGTAGVLLYHLGAYALFRRRVRPFLIEETTPRPWEPGVYRCACIRGPMLLGYLKPMILLPEVEYSPGEREAVLAHERAHFRRGDVWYKLVLLLACAVHWFNPVVWLMARRAGQDMEFACDELVIRRLGPAYRKEYSNAILKSAERSGT